MHVQSLKEMFENSYSRWSEKPAIILDIYKIQKIKSLTYMAANCDLAMTMENNDILNFLGNYFLSISWRYRKFDND